MVANTIDIHEWNIYGLLDSDVACGISGLTGYDTLTTLRWYIATISMLS